MDSALQQNDGAFVIPSKDGIHRRGDASASLTSEYVQHVGLYFNGMTRAYILPLIHHFRPVRALLLFKHQCSCLLDPLVTADATSGIEKVIYLRDTFWVELGDFFEGIDAEVMEFSF